MLDRNSPDGESLAAVAGGVTKTRPNDVGGLPRRLTIVYALLGALWIVSSDYFLSALVEANEWSPTHSQTVKGWLFIIVTAVSLFFILNHLARRVTAANTRLASFEDSFRDYAESASDWLWEMGPDLRFTFLSDRFQEITGIDPKSVLGRTRFELFADPAQAGLRDQHIADMAARRPFKDLVYPSQGKDGSVRYLRVSGKPAFAQDGTFLGYRGIGNDVTTEIHARLASARLAAIVEAAPDFIGTATADQRILFINRAGRKQLALSAEDDVTALSISDLHPPETLKLLNEIAIPTAAREGSWSGETVLLTRDGTEIPIFQSVLAHRDENENVAYFSTIARDLSEVRRTEQHLRTVQKMDALGQLTGGIAHDFNNLLVIVLGNAEFLLERSQGDAQNQQLAEHIIHAAERGADLTHRLLAFSRQQSLKPEPVDIDALLVSIEKLLQRTLGEQIEVRTISERDLWPVFVDKGEFETCLLNLAINARDAMPRGGALTLESQNFTIDAANGHEFPALSDGEYVCLAVSDTGVGMTRDVVERVFEPFFTTKEVGKGTGLGLSMVFGFAKQSGGNVTVYSEPGVGSTFKIYLPRDTSTTKHSPGSVHRTAVFPRGHESILVVEDDKLVRSYVVGQLRDLGYNVESAENGVEGLRMLKSGLQLDLLLTDVVMPGGLSGPDLVREARLLRPDLKILYTTGYAEKATMARHGLGPETRILSKPYRREQLARMVREAFEVEVSA